MSAPTNAPEGAAGTAGNNKTAANDNAEGKSNTEGKARAEDKARNAAALTLLKQALDNGLGFLRRTDPDAAADLDELRRRTVSRPAFAVVGETKRGKSSLVNALIGVPDLSPVDAAVATAAYLEFSHARTAGARAHVPGSEQPVELDLAELRDWGTALGRLPDGVRPPRRIEVGYPAPLLSYLTLVDTPGVGGLDSLHAEIAMDAVERATALLFVVDASSPFSGPELNFLIEASKRINFVVFALTKVDAYPGWRTILADNRGQLQAHAPRFASAPWYPVSARLAQLAMTMPGTGDELVTESRVGTLQHALIDLAGRGHVLSQANVLRALRSEIVRLDQEVGARIQATDPDPAQTEKLRQERTRLAARKRTETRQWQLTLSTETQRARVESTTRLRLHVSKLQEEFMSRIDKAGGADLKTMPEQLDRALHGLSIRLSQELEWRFRQVGQKVLSQVFTPEQLQFVLRRLNARLRHALETKPRREGGSGDGAVVVMSSASMAVMAGRYGVQAAGAGASALGLAGIAGSAILLPVGIGLGLAAGAFMVWKRKSMTDKVQQRTWLREVMGEARAALSDEITHRFTDLQYALTLALDDAIERRIQQLDEHLVDLDKSAAEDKAVRAKRRTALQAERDALRGRFKQTDEVLAKIRPLLPGTGAEPAG